MALSMDKRETARMVFAQLIGAWVATHRDQPAADDLRLFAKTAVEASQILEEEFKA